MNRQETIKRLREVISVLKDESVFVDSDFDFEKVEDVLFPSRVVLFIRRKLDL